MSAIDRLATLLCGWFALDRALKALAIVRFFRRPPPAPPRTWPAITLLQPITRGVHDLEATLRARLGLRYPAALQHLWIVDRDDATTRAVCERLRAEQNDSVVGIVVVPPDLGPIATKTAKLLAALPHARGEVLWFLDDDVTLPRDGLAQALPYLLDSGVGSIFGLARYTSWRTNASSAMSAFVNANALPSYVPLTFLAEPYTITGHCYAIRREVWDRIGGDDALVGRIDDDHELARRIRAASLRNVQTPLIYGVNNDLPDLRAYLGQMRRWFVLPRLLMLPYLSRRDRNATALGSAANGAPPLLLALALIARSGKAWRRLGATLLIALANYLWIERRIVGARTPLARLPLVLLGALIEPPLIVYGLLAGDTITWRGLRLRVRPDGTIQRVED